VSGPRRAPAVDRAVDILNYLAAHPTDAFSMSELSRLLGINNASVHAVLGALTKAGYVERHPRHRTYRLGPGLVVVGQAALSQHRVNDEATTEIDALSKQLDLEVVVTALVGADMVYVGSAGRPQLSAPQFRVGQRVPCVPPYGTVHMAWSSADEIDDWLKSAPTALTPEQRAKQLGILEAVRDRGYAVGLDLGSAHIDVNRMSESLTDAPGREDLKRDINALFERLGNAEYQLETLGSGEIYDVSMISAPVFDPQGRVAVAITLAGLPRHLEAAAVVEFAETVTRTARAVSKRVLGVPPVPIQLSP
jgi:DNA-binding IclR family transcriptional regulator